VKLEIRQKNNGDILIELNEITLPQNWNYPKTVIAKIYQCFGLSEQNLLRLARLFQKAEELEEFARDWNNLSGNDDFALIEKWGQTKNHVSRLGKTLNYIEHGEPKEEMVKVRANKPRCCMHQKYVEFYPSVDIPKSEAIRLGLIKE
jgi:hypothetical protein